MSIHSFIRYKCCFKVKNKRDDTYELYKKDNNVNSFIRSYQCCLKIKNKRDDTYPLYKKENKM